MLIIDLDTHTYVHAWLMCACDHTSLVFKVLSHINYQSPSALQPVQPIDTHTYVHAWLVCACDHTSLVFKVLSHINYQSPSALQPIQPMMHA